MKFVLRCAAVAATVLATAGIASGDMFLPALRRSFVNPAPISHGSFGCAVEALGPDRVIVGSDAAGGTGSVVHVYGTNGTILSLLTNPLPSGDYFGATIVKSGLDRIVVGAYRADLGATDAGAVFIFDTNGILLTTITNPTPVANTPAWFGNSLAALGEDKVLIGAPQFGAGVGHPRDGRVYLFDTDARLITTFTNPVPESFDYFGGAVAALGTDRVLISAPLKSVGFTNATGILYLFSTNGTLLTTFNDPTPSGGDGFGRSVEMIDQNSFLVSADDNTVYRYDTNGTLISTFPNPFPGGNDQFGYDVSVIDTAHFLVGAPGDSPRFTFRPGTAFLYHTNGTLLCTFTNPAPSPGNEEKFGFAVVALDAATFVIGAPWDGATPYRAGSTYLLSWIPPRLRHVPLANGNLQLFWTPALLGYVVEETLGLDLFSQSEWTPVPFPYLTNFDRITVTVTPSDEKRFYRLRNSYPEFPGP